MDKAENKAVPKVGMDAPEVELLPDAWERFEKAVDQVAKSPPQHRKSENGGKSKKNP